MFIHCITPTSWTVWKRVFFYIHWCISTISHPGPKLCEIIFFSFTYVHFHIAPRSHSVQNRIFFCVHIFTPTVSHRVPYPMKVGILLQSLMYTYCITTPVISVYTGARWGLDQISKGRLHEELQEKEARPRKVSTTWPVHSGDGQHTTQGNHYDGKVLIFTIELHYHKAVWGIYVYFIKGCVQKKVEKKVLYYMKNLKQRWLQVLRKRLMHKRV